MEGFVPTDHGRWKFSKASEHARMKFTDQLERFDIAHREENWIKFDNTFHSIVELLELKSYVFDPIQPHPQSHADLMRSYANNDGIMYAEQLVVKISAIMFSCPLRSARQ